MEDTILNRQPFISLKFLFLCLFFAGTLGLDPIRFLTLRHIVGTECAPACCSRNRDYFYFPPLFIHPAESAVT